MSIDASFQSTCSVCQDQINVGDPIVRDADTGFYVHEDCGDDSPKALLKPPPSEAEKCPMCTMPTEWPVHGNCHAQAAFSGLNGAPETPAVVAYRSVSLASISSLGQGDAVVVDDDNVVAAWVPEGSTTVRTIEARPEPKRDRWGRYVLPLADQPKNEQSYTRATTICNEIQDDYLINRWRERKLARGMGMKEELYGLAASHTDPDKEHRKVFEDIVERAHEAAGTNAKRDKGTALHRLLEMLDLGQITLAEIPSIWRGQAQNYTETLAANGITVEPEHIERVYIDDRYQVAGMGDRTLRLPDRRLRVIGDLKTGDTVKYSAVEHACQLAIYQDHTDTFDVGQKRRVGKLDIDPEIGIIIHLPQGGTTCELIQVDLAFGREAYMVALERREIRKTKDDRIRRPYVPRGSLQPYDWISQRLWALVGLEPAVAEVLAAHWPDGVRKPFPSDPTRAEVDAMDATLQPLERYLGAPFALPVAT